MDDAIAKGDSLLEQGRLDEADRYFEALASKRPGEPEPLRGLIRVGQAFRDTQDLIARLDRFLELQPDALEERCQRLQIRASRGDIERARSELPRLLDLADARPFERRTGKRLQRLVQFCCTGSRRVASLIRLRERAERAVNEGADGPRADRVFLAEVQLALGDYDEFGDTVDSLGEDARANALVRDLRRVREKVVARRFPDFEREKVFGIGLTRTGTTSLHRALGRLGFHSLHWDNPMTCDLIQPRDFVLYDAFSDIPVSSQFEWLYHTFPNSKFVLTIRDVESWRKSIALHYQNQHDLSGIESLAGDPARRKFELKSAQMTANLYTQHSSWVEAHSRYHERVHEFFRDKPKSRFLRLNVVAGEGYEKLCAFLGRPAPEASFPNSNPSPARVVAGRGPS